MPISDYLLDTAEQERRDARVRNGWMIQIRWLYLIILGAVGIAATSIADNDRMNLELYLLLLMIGIAANGLLWLANLPKNNPTSYYRAIGLLQVLIDLILASAVIYSQAGLGSRANILYAIPILITGILLRGNYALATALLSAIAYIFTLFIYHLYNPQAYTSYDILPPAIFYTSVFIVIALIVRKFTATNQLIEKERSYSELLAMLRHQLRHPTSVVSVIVEMLEKSPEAKGLSREQKQYIKQIGYENNRLINMVSNLLAFSDPESVSKKRAHLNLISLVDAAAIEASSAHNRLKDLEVDFPLERYVVHGNKQQLNLAIINIVDNACRYSLKNTPISIKITAENEYAFIAIVDKGDPLSASNYRKILETLSKTDKSKKYFSKHSLGIGLYVSKVIIERFGGKIDVKPDSNNKGTRVTIQLPLIKGEPSDE